MIRRAGRLGPAQNQLRARLTPSLIRSVQSGVITGAGTSATATITAVDTANSILVFGGFSRTVVSFGNEYAYTFARLDLTNSTTVTATRNAADGTLFMGYTVVEFWPGVLRRVQRGTITVAAVLSNTATITAVLPGKSTVQCLGWTTSTDLASENLNVTLTNATTVTATKQVTTGTQIVSYEVWEWY